MADRRSATSGANDLDFITGNPATEAFRAGEEAGQKRAAADLAIEHAIVANAEQTAGAPTRLRRLTADTDTARAGADVAVATVPSKISQDRSAASLAGTNASVQAQTAPYRVDDAYQSNRTNAAGADVAVATVPDKIGTSRIGLRQQEANLVNTKVGAFHKSLDLLNTGQTEAAIATARMAGEELPPEIINNAELRAGVTAIAKRALELYPDRPRDQQTFIEAWVKELATRRQSGQPPNAPTATYQMPGGAPEPVEDNTRGNFEIVHRQETDATGQPVVRSYKFDKAAGTMEALDGSGAFTKATGAGTGGAAGGRTSVFQQKQTAWLAVHPGDNEGALAYASGRRQLSEPEIAKAAIAMAGSEIKNNFQLKFRNQAEQSQAITKRAGEIAGSLRAGLAQPGAPAATAVPGAPPTAAPAAPAASLGTIEPAPRDPGQRMVNKVYVAPDGRKVEWLGTGWRVVQ